MHLDQQTTRFSLTVCLPGDNTNILWDVSCLNKLTSNVIHKTQRSQVKKKIKVGTIAASNIASCINQYLTTVINLADASSSSSSAAAAAAAAWQMQ